MATNGEHSIEDTDMADCDEEKVVTMVDVLQEQQDFEEAANAVLGASDDKNCTYPKGYIKRQAIYACMTCCAESKDDPSKRAGVCLACSLICHEKHDLIELYTKRNFRCDCGNPKFNAHPCRFTPNKDDLNEDNIYNQNFCGLYCTCHRPYPDPKCPEMDDMIQCIICEDWYHALHLESPVPVNDYAEMICKDCMEKNEFFHDYSDLAVNTENADIDVVCPNNSITQELITNGEKAFYDTNTSDDVEMDGSRTIDKNQSSISMINKPLDDENKNENQNDSEKSELGESEPKQDEIIESLEKLLESDKTTTNDENMQEKINDNTLDKSANVSHLKSLVESKDEQNISVMEIKENEKLNVLESIGNERDEKPEEQNTPEAEKIDEDYLLAEDPISEENKQQNDVICDKNEFNENLKTNDHNKVDEHVSELAQTVDKPLEASSLIEKTEEEKLLDIMNTEDKSQDMEENRLLVENLIPDENKHQDNLICEIASDLKNEIDENFQTNDYNKVNENVPESTQTLLDKQLEKAPIEIEKTEEKLLDEQQQHVEEKAQDEETAKDVSCESKVNENNFESTDIENLEEYSISKDSVSSDPMNDAENNFKNASETKIDVDYTNTNETLESEEPKTSDLNGSEICQDQLTDKNLEEPSSNDLKEQTNGYSENIEISNENLESSQIDNNKMNIETPEPAETLAEQIVSENKRKLSIEDAKAEDDVSVKRTKPNEDSVCLRPNGTRRIYKGATFWPSNFRQKLCTCNECITMYKDLSVLFLIDPEDTVSAYTYLGESKGLQSQYEKGLEALSSLDRIQQINAITEYNNLRDKLLDFLKSFKERQEVVKEEDIQAFFANIKPKREPDGVYFCR